MKRNRNPINITILVVLSLFLAVNLVPNTAQTACVQPPTGLVSWWPADGNANDVVQGKNGVLDGGATFAPGLVGQAFSLNGVSASVPTPVTLPQVGTIECWINIDPLFPSIVWPIGATHGILSGQDRLVIVGIGPGGAGGIPPNTLVVNLGSGTENDINVPISFLPGTWMHVALTFDYVADVYDLYVNGVSQAHVTPGRNAPTQAYRIGGITADYGDLYFFPGMIDEVSIYDRVLSASEIASIFNAGSDGKCKSMPADQDNDGVPDATDACPDTPPASIVDARGCTPYQNGYYAAKAEDTSLISQKDQQIAHLTQQLNNLTAAVAQKDQQITNLTQQVNDLTTASAQKDQQISGLTQQVNDLTKQVSDLNATVTQKNQEIAALSQQVNGLTQQVALLTQQNNTLNQQVINLTATMATMYTAEQVKQIIADTCPGKSEKGDKDKPPKGK